MKHRYLLLFSLIPIALVLSVILIPRLKAETPVTPQTNPKAVAELIETLKIWKLIQAVSPTSEQSVPLLTKFNELEALKRSYRQGHRQAMDRLKRLRSVHIETPNRQVELHTSLDHKRQLEANFIEQRQKITDDINQILTLEQQIKFEVFSYTYRQDLKKTLQTLIALQGEE